MDKRRMAFLRRVAGYLISSFVVLVLCQGGSREWHANLFAMMTFVSPILVFLVSQLRLKWQIIEAGAATLYWLLLYVSFVDYKDHPWFDPRDPYSCDGPCFGWYTFEFDPPFHRLFSAAIAGMVCGLVLYGAIKWRSRAVSR